MKHEKYYSLDDIAYIFNGYTRAFLRNKKNIDKLENKTKVKIINWQEIKKYCKEMNIKNTLEEIEFSRTYDKEIKYMKKGDIVFPIKSGIENTENIYIDKDPQEKIVYDSSVFVIRTIDSSVDAKYIYIMLNIDTIQKKLKKMEWKKANERFEKRTKRRVLGIPTAYLVPRLTTEILRSILIIKLTEDERRKIVEEYDRLNKAQDDFNNKLIKLQTQDKDKSDIIWLQENKK